jgi:chromate transporter
LLVPVRCLSMNGSHEGLSSDSLSPDNSSAQVRPSLAEVALVFLKLGTIGFGGPAAHIAMMEDEFVRRRRWLTEADFLDRLAMANLIPGPSSTELAIFIGYSKRGWAGLLVAGCSFIIPAAILVTLIAAFYVKFGALPQVAGILYGIKPAVIAIIAQALWSLGRKAVKTWWLAVIGIGAVVLNAGGVSPVSVLALCGSASGVGFWISAKRGPAASLLAFGGPKRPLWLVGTAAASMMVAIPVSMLRLFLSFFKIGAVVFGSGYVLLAFLRAEFIEHLHWITERQLIDAIAVGQFTPGPVFTTATFIGYVVAGWRGAWIATIAIFLPGFVFVAVSGRVLTRLRRSALAVSVMDGVVAGSLALMAVVAWQLGRAAIVDWVTLVIMVASAALLLRFRMNSAWIICAAGVIGWLVGR